MKKLRLIAAVAFVVMLCCLLAVGASAKWWDDNPFTDVKSSSWYYDAVRICNENGLFEGMTETTFSTSTGMTRSMFVTVLAAADDSYDASQYTESSFSDIRVGSWYHAPAEWANSIGVANGIGEGAFGPKNTITRQELALMLYKYAQYKGMDVATDGSVDMSAYPDNSTASSWATTALEWSVQNGLISGVANGNETILSPKGTATRAMVAQIMVKYLALDPVREINGNDIANYTIVYSAAEIESVGEAAHALADHIEMALGYTLPVVTDDAEVGEYEILVGKTNREDKGIVSVDRDAFEKDTEFIWSVQDNYLVISGIDSSAERDTGDRTTMNIDGTKNAVLYFAEDVLGIEFYMIYHDVVVATPDPIISLENGYRHTDGPFFKWRTVEVDGCYISKCENYYSEWGCGFPHQLGNLMMGYWKEGRYDNVWANPCYTDPDNIESLKTNIRELLEKNPNLNLVGLIQNDSNEYCTCETCLDAFREAGGRSGAIIKLINLMCETFEDEYPNVKFATWAYNWSFTPPKNIELHKNVVVYYNTLVLCTGHAYSETECQYNKNALKNLQKWAELAEEIFLWDHSGCVVNPITPCPNFDVLDDNVRMFGEYGVDGVFMNAISTYRGHSDFNVMRGYLFDHLFRNPFMTEEEYNYRIDSFLREYYGAGWRLLREYLDEIQILGKTKCHGFYTETPGYFDYNEIIPCIERFDAIWSKAKENLDSEQLRHVEQAEMSWIYLKQCALFESQYKNGDETNRSAYRNENKRLYELLVKFDQDYMVAGYSSSQSPDLWIQWME